MRGLNKHYFKMPTSYVQELHNKNKRKKARAFMEYYFDLQNDAVNSIRFYAKSWEIGLGTADRWVFDFKHKIESFLTCWTLINDIEQSHTQKMVEQKWNTQNLRMEQKNVILEPILSDFENNEWNTQNLRMEQKWNKDYNNINNNNIHVDYEKSTSINGEIERSNKSKKANSKYNPDFEYLWHLYDKKSSNKKRAFSIYLKRFKSTNLELIEKSIIKYKENIDLKYQKDFDGFLNGLIDIYLPKKAFLIDKNDKKHIGIFYDYDNTFIINEKQKLEVDSDKLASLIQTQRFGYLND